jgi:tetratricopeptide (TPR) repeat protein
MIQPGEGEHNREKAAVIFERAKQIAAKGNFDYAITMYIEGLRLNPDDLKNGHLALREMSLLRMQRNGKKPSMVERMKYSGGKSALDQMLNAEFLLAKDPEHIAYLQAMLKASYTGGFVKTTVWLADLFFTVTNSAERQSANAYILLKDAYASIGEYEKAIIACKRAAQLRPSDGMLDEEFKRLSAEYTMSRGKYDQEGDFTNSIKDKEKQRTIQASQGVVKSDDFRKRLIDDARDKLKVNPTSQLNILNMAKVLSDAEEDGPENEAISLLKDAYEDQPDYEYQKKANEIKINQLRRHLRQAKKQAKADPADSAAAQRVEVYKKKVVQAELVHWRMTSQYYPTDLQAKYEYAVRLLEAGHYDAAIPLFQQSQRDPRRKISSMTNIGKCFFEKGWLGDAEEIFLRTIEEYEIKDDAIAKDLQYNLGLCYEKQGKTDEAVGMYRRIAQVDFAYRDVSKRLDALRK